MNRPLAPTIAAEVAKNAYPAGVAIFTTVGLNLDSMVKLTAILAALLSAGYTAWKWWHDAHKTRREHARAKPTVPGNK